MIASQWILRIYHVKCHRWVILKALKLVREVDNKMKGRRNVLKIKEKFYKPNRLLGKRRKCQNKQYENICKKQDSKSESE